MSKKMFTLIACLIIFSTLLSACASAASTKPYIPVISKGFQHQFWQAVKQGSMNAAKDLNVDITFEGPETEAMVDKQVEISDRPG